jgi:hypothetical protein
VKHKVDSAVVVVVYMATRCIARDKKSVKDGTMVIAWFDVFLLQSCGLFVDLVCYLPQLNLFYVVHF